MKDKGKNIFDDQKQCDHDFQMLDLGTGHYGCYMCTKCGLDKDDWERQQNQ